MQFLKEIFQKVTRKQSGEFGQVAVLVCIILALYLKSNHFVKAAFWLMLVCILVPYFFYPFAVIWFGLSRVLNKISSFIILNLVFLILVIPIGIFRKIMGRDSLRIKQFKKDRESVMTVRNHLYEASDLKNTF
jgi:hypothetical protein